MPKKITTSDWIKDAKSIHGNRYDYSSTEYLGAVKKVSIRCKSHGVFVQLPANHLKGCGCPDCGNESISKANSGNKDSFIRSAQTVHGNKYDYAEVEYVNNVTRVRIICRVHGSFSQTPSDHIGGNGCKKCGAEIIAVSRSSSTEKFIAKAKEKHGERYDYSRVKYSRTNVPVEIVCTKHGPFLQIPYSHLDGHGCSGCCNGSSSSAIRWIESEAKRRRLKNVRHARNGGEFIIPGTRFKVDGYHEKSKTVFEFHGDAFHGNPDVFKPRSKPNPFSDKTAQRLYRETLAREEKIKALGYTLVVMWENDFKILNRGIK